MNLRTTLGFSLVISLIYEGTCSQISILGDSLIGGLCNSAADCVTPERALCHNQVCYCQAEFVPKTDLTRCLEKKQLGERCEEDHQCVVDGSACMYFGEGGWRCVCDPGHVPSGDNTKCLPKSDLGGQCQEDQQCWVDYSLCEEDGNGLSARICRCDSRISVQSEDGNVCLLKAFLGDPCLESAQCSATVSNSDCLGDPGRKVCKCLNNYISPPGAPNVCVKLAGVIGDSCAEDPVQCNNLEGSVCDSGICLCEPEEFVESEIMPGRCVTIVDEIDGVCDENIQCTTGLGNTTYCSIEGKCQCRDGYSFVGGECKADDGGGAPGLGDICHNDEECQLGVNNYTECVPDFETHEFRCACIPEAIQEGDTCVMRRIGDSCTKTSQCTRGIAGEVECDPCMDVCWCLEGHMPSDKWTKCVLTACHAGKSFWEI